MDLVGRPGASRPLAAAGPVLTLGTGPRANARQCEEEVQGKTGTALFCCKRITSLSPGGRLLPRMSCAWVILPLGVPCSRSSVPVRSYPTQPKRLPGGGSRGEIDHGDSLKWVSTIAANRCMSSANLSVALCVGEMGGESHFDLPELLQSSTMVRDRHGAK